MLRVGENGADSLVSQDLKDLKDLLACCLAGGGFPRAVLIFPPVFLLSDPYWYRPPRLKFVSIVSPFYHRDQSSTPSR